MRDRETIDSELRLLALSRRSIREQGGQPSSREVDELLDERLGHLVAAPAAVDARATPVDPAPRAKRGGTGGIRTARRKGVLRRFGLLAALPLSLVAVGAAFVVMLSVHRPDSAAQPTDVPPPSSARPSPAPPKALPPPFAIVDSAFIDALKREGVPVPSNEYVTTQGHAVCDFLNHRPNFADAVGFVQRTSVWDADQSADVTAGAIVSYCPQYQPSGPDDVQPAFGKTLSDLQAIQGDLQGIRGDLQGIEGSLPPIPGHQ